MFAKLYDTEDRGQILILLQNNNEGNPELRAYCQPDGLGLCSAAIEWADDDDGYDSQEDCFASCTEDFARKMTDGVFDALSKMSLPNAEVERGGLQPEQNNAASTPSI